MNLIARYLGIALVVSSLSLVLSTAQAEATKPLALEKSNDKLLAEEAALLKKMEAAKKSIAEGAPKKIETAPVITNDPLPGMEPVKVSDAPAPPLLTDAQKAAIDKEIPAAKGAPAEVKKETSKKEPAIAPKEEKLLPAGIVEAGAKTIAPKNQGGALTNELASARAKIAKLSADLEEARNRLMISETEVERLSSLLQDRGRGGAKSSAPSERASLSSSGMRVREPGEIQAKADSDMPIATVIAEKVQLRTGPGKNNSPLMTVSQGTRLAVETRSGEWYRVIAPTGARAWVSSDVVDFGGVAGKADSAARSKGFSRDIEQEAFDLLTKNGQPAPQ